MFFGSHCNGEQMQIRSLVIGWLLRPFRDPSQIQASFMQSLPLAGSFHAYLLAVSKPEQIDPRLERLG